MERLNDSDRLEEIITMTSPNNQKRLKTKLMLVLRAGKEDKDSDRN